MRVLLNLRGISILLLSLIVGLAIGIGVPVSAFAESHDVEILRGATTLGDKSYSPNPLQISSGDSVVFFNGDTVLHTATSGSTGVASGVFDTGYLGPNRSAEVVINGTGDIPYFCMAHPTMVGLVKVSEAPVQDKTEATVETVYQDRTYVVKSVSTGSIRATSVTINPGLSVMVQLDGSGEVELNLPSGMIEGINSVTSADGTVITFTKEEETDTYTRISFEVPPNENPSVTIMGARVVPEFPAIFLVFAGLAAALVVIFGRVSGARKFAPNV